MQWFYALKNESIPSLSSSLVDCDKCQVISPGHQMMEYTLENKCCEFSPFVSAFALGALIEKGVDLKSLVDDAQGGLVLTKLGVVHSEKHRAKPGSLCRYFNPETRGCNIWWHRNPTCFTFFCVTEKTNQWGELEMLLLEEETQWLKKWFENLQLNEATWSEWGLYMESKPLVMLPKDLQVESFDKAMGMYSESLNWLREQW